MCGKGNRLYNLPVGERGRIARAGVLLAFSAFVVGTWLPRAISGHWIADDYIFVSSSVHDGFWRAQQIVYMTAAGRYTVPFLNGSVGRLGSWTAPVIAIGCMALWLVAAARAAHHAFRLADARASRLETIAAGAGFVAAVMCAAPDDYQPLIWLNGLATYGLPIIGATVIAWLVMREQQLPIAAGLIALVTGGCSEVAALAQIAFATAIALVAPRLRKSLITIAVASAIAFILVVIAPGNFARRTRFEKPMPMWDAVLTAAEKTPGMIAATALKGYIGFLPLLVLIALAGSEPRPVARSAAALTVAAAIGVMFATLCGFFYGTGKMPWGRVQFVPVAYFTIAVVFVAFAIRSKPSHAVSAALSISIALVACAGVISQAPIRVQSIRDARDFAVAAQRVEDAARASKGKPLVIAAPRTFDNVDYLSSDPEYWTNRAMALYYGLPSIRSATVSSR